MKLVSGGQTGVDRAALDAAIGSGVSAGGWCPQGRLAEDGPIPSRYPLTELAGAGYRERTRRNVIDSDATCIVYFDELTGGTAQTAAFCVAEKKPFLLVDGAELGTARAAEKLAAFCLRHAVSVLNVAGPRASGEPRAYATARAIIERFLAALR